MNYIVFDMEWNQPVCRERTILRPFPLRGEIFQIGAVKLGEDKQYLDGMNLIIRPVYYKKLNRRVAKIVGVDAETIAAGAPFAEAIRQFRDWCGPECIFFTWGFDDMPMLVDNLRLHNLDTGWLPRAYNLQIMFNRQIADGETKICSLESALEKMEIEPDEQFHDAFNDALYTSTVLSRMDIVRGMSDYEEDIAASESYSWLNAVERCGFASVDAVFADPEFSGFVCPVCGETMASAVGWLNQRDHRKIAIAACPEHGEYFFKLRAKKLTDTNFLARKNCCQISDALRAYFDEKKKKHDEAEAENKKRFRRRRRRPRREAAEGAEAPRQVQTVAAAVNEAAGGEAGV